MDIYNLRTLPSDCSIDKVGGKAFNLMQLNSININVPNGFVISSDKIENLFESESYQENLKNLKSEWVMVRSSAVGEDGDDFSFAGQLESFKVANTSEEIRKGIYKCWESLGSDRVQSYEQKTGKRLVKMGVIVQEMIEPDYAGVLFTKSPAGEESGLVEYVEGHCEKLVQGEVTPVSKPITSHTDFPFPMEELKHQADRIRNYYKTEQDIEWTFKNGEFHFVQARPITNLKTQIKWSSTNVNENYPNKLSPLLYSIARRSYYFYFKNLARELQLTIPNSAEKEFYNVIGLWGHRMYYNMTHLHSLFALTPFAKLITKSFDDFVGYQKEQNYKKRASAALDKLRFFMALIKNYRKLDIHVDLIKNRVDSFYNKETRKESLAQDFHEFLDMRFNFWYHASFADFFAMLFHGALGQFLKKLKIQDAGGGQNKLIQSIPNLESNKPIYRLWEIKKEIESQDIAKVFRVYETQTIAEELDKINKPVHTLVSAYIQEWGFRCTGELTFLSENFIEKPENFIKMLKAYINSSDQDPKAHFEAKRQEQEDYQKSLEREIKKKHLFLAPIYCWALRFIVNATMKSISARETVRLRQAKMYFKFKKICQTLESSLIESKKLKNKNEIFYLEYDEISRILNYEETDWDYIASLIELRQKSLNQAGEKSENLASFAFEHDNNYLDQDIALNQDKYSGLPACGGKITARAVVIDSISQIDQVQEGDILVTKQTDPGWICAFPLISGLVVERGGMLSHGAIVAREFGIPAVVGLKGITKMIKTGDMIEVDGNLGRINVEL